MPSGDPIPNTRYAYTDTVCECCNSRITLEDQQPCAECDAMGCVHCTQLRGCLSLCVDYIGEE